MTNYPNEETTKQQRTAYLQELLKCIEEQDPLFERNVPLEKRTSGDNQNNQEILDYLKETYAQNEFIISEPDQVRRYITPHDKVTSRWNIFDEEKIIRAYEECVVKNILPKGKVIIKTRERKKNVKGTVEEKCLNIIGHYTGIFNPDKYLNAIGALDFDAKTETAKRLFRQGVRLKSLKSIEEDDLVIVEKDTSFGPYFIPEGTEGVVANISNEGNLIVYWMQKQGLKVEIKQFNDNTHTNIYTRPNAKVTYKDVILAKQNIVDFQKLYKEIYGV